ncbi:MAG TPA: DinB family protein [Pyrinomonadaceae bacterium]|nr:DinB family protein [Pyrinomonadaceae bacterium]
MKALDLFLDLYRHMEWADATVWRAVLNSPAACDDERIKTWLHHIHMVQHAFNNVWHGQPPTPNAGNDLAITQLPAWGREFHQAASVYLQTVSENDLDSPLALPWAKYLTKHTGRDPEGTSKGETIMQVAAHSTYHRGQVNARLRELGAEPPLVDFIAWLWFGRPDADWTRRTD